MGLILTYNKLKQTLTESEGYDYILQLAKTFKFPATSFISGSIGYSILKIQGAILAIISDSVAEITKQIYLEDSEEDYLTILADNHFDIQRFEETQTVVKLRLTTTGAVAATYDPESVNVKIDDVEFYNTSEFSVTTDGYTDVNFTSIEYGSDTRPATNVIPIFTMNSIGNCVFSNISNEDGYFQIISNGQDTETDEFLKERCSTKFASLSNLGPEQAIKSWVLNAINSDGVPVDITRIKIDRSEAQRIGVVVVYCANDTGAASLEDIAAADIVVQQNRSICSTMYVDPANEVNFLYNLQVTVDGTAELDDSILKAEILECIKDYISTIPIGGTMINETQGYVFLSEIIDRIMDVTGVLNVTCTTLVAGDTTWFADFDIELNHYDVPTINNTTQLAGITLVRV